MTALRDDPVGRGAFGQGGVAVRILPELLLVAGAGRVWPPPQRLVHRESSWPNGKMEAGFPPGQLSREGNGRFQKRR